MEPKSIKIYPEEWSWQTLHGTSNKIRPKFQRKKQKTFKIWWENFKYVYLRKKYQNLYYKLNNTCILQKSFNSGSEKE